ncbi:hypothetical protein FCM35_KLT04311 [Carex littledalei]|uniref:Uncharacterized protein n=1 Tax=Carex littledalei TaxID=544730 RepID=A0A833VAI4_9POAL|nr:hypothetical protein FCM35_KLT04311 [Carex littledalei]
MLNHIKTKQISGRIKWSTINGHLSSLLPVATRENCATEAKISLCAPLSHLSLPNANVSPFLPPTSPVLHETPLSPSPQNQPFQTPQTPRGEIPRQRPRSCSIPRETEVGARALDSGEPIPGLCHCRRGHCMRKSVGLSVVCKEGTSVVQLFSGSNYVGHGTHA